MVLQNDSFRRQNLFVIIDEVHVVEQWATFRHMYAQVWQLRAQLPPSARVLGCSATLDDRTREKVVELAGLRNLCVINTTTDRPEIFIDIRPDDGGGKTFTPLRFLFPDQLDPAGIFTTATL